MISTDDVPTDDQVETDAPAAEADAADGRAAQSAVEAGVPVSRRPVELDAAAIELALGAARSDAGDEAGGVESVGEYLGAHAEDEIAVTAGFRARIRGYHGWQWTVTLAAVSADSWTVSEVVLLPGEDALVAPPWVPWDRRVRGGDLGPGDLLPTPADDDRLVPGYLLSDDPAVEDVARELGLGRKRVLSREGRIDAADRWYSGSFGPSDPMAQQAPGRCGQCGFFVPLAGSLGGMFGACANDMAPGDARVVAVEYGCGAHSEAVAAILEPSGQNDLDGLRVDEERIDVHVREQVELTAAQVGVDPDEDPEPVDHDELADVALLDGVDLDGVELEDVALDESPASADPELVAGAERPASALSDPEAAAAPSPDEDAALQAVLELLPPISGTSESSPDSTTDTAAGAGTDISTDTGVVSD